MIFLFDFQDREGYTTSCPAQWVSHFDKKYYYLKFKKEMAETGYQAKDDEFTKKKQDSWLNC